MNEEIITTNDEVIEEATEEIVKATSNGRFKKATTIGLAMIAGGLAYKFVVNPGVAKLKDWHAKRKAEKQGFFEGEFTEVNNSEEESDN